MNADSSLPSSPAPGIPAGLHPSSRVETLCMAAGGSHTLLLVPRADETGPEAIETLRRWVADLPADRPRHRIELPILLRLYNVDLVWSPARSAAIAGDDRFGSIREAVTDFTSLEAELTAIEDGIATAWPAYEADLPHAYGFSDSSIALRDTLLARYGSVKSLQGRLARLTKQIMQPAPQPPTLAGQIGERLRERLRVEDRDEAADGELEVLSDHYDACGQRASDFMIARREQMLSWIIIVLLATETLLFAIDLLSNAGT
jgi:hypothetical protein